ncbi:GrlR family regulatory protein [Rhodobacter calidifons]|uniref:Type III secretion system (T3SS) negative regulator GrlR n=1 Tax=Rhodobacter calidifons TaxID=2715277 RepID=A0ABX0GAR6_9RHOB|nr:GrlR family regulatory protein [Rhodobacter calidifons]NHB77983.1 hypothetical protein [Rhodobacter calidifons]
MTTVEGLYWVQFESNLGLVGVGEIHVHDGVFRGKDDGYTYRGYLVRRGGCYFGKAVIIRTTPDALSIFGPVERFELELSGRFEGGELRFSGHVVGAEHLRLRFVLMRQVSFAAE